MTPTDIIQSLDKLIGEMDFPRGRKEVRSVLSKHASKLTLIVDELESDLRRVGLFAGSEQ